MNKKKAIIFGSARSDGETRKIVDELMSSGEFELIDLNDFKISYYDYDHNNIDDDFLPLAKRLTEECDTLIYATPVYWYSMSATLKTFFDRYSDLLTIDKETGRKLRGMKTAVITTSYGNNTGDAFWVPFKGAADYLGMSFLGGLHTVLGTDATEDIKEFSKMILNS